MKIFSPVFYIFCSLASVVACAQSSKPVYTSGAYTVYPDRVVQDKYVAKVTPDGELTSNYKSPANRYKSPVVDFKFSINGKDNELPSGVDHHYACVSASNTTPPIKFGEKYADTRPVTPGAYLQPGTKFTIRLDMRDVLNDFKTKGYHAFFNGEKLYKNDFKGVYVAGNTAPLIWDFNNLVNHPELELKDPDGDGIYETRIVLNKPEDAKSIASSWKLSRDISAFPEYISSYPISDVVYKLALEEMGKAIEPDSTFRTGKEWSGVWTRDISYSITLSMAILQPKVAVYSLMRKVKDGRIIQDTGTGGAYPVSSDRMIWAVAAWEVYKVTGDEEWLKKAYEIIKKSAADDVINVYDTQTGLVRGESSFLDWREETYPKWMQPADIYESECLGTNAIHYQVNKVLAQMAKHLGYTEAGQAYLEHAKQIQVGISNRLWQSDRGYYGQYIYGRNYKMLSPRSEALGEALTVLFDIGTPQQQGSVIKNTPVNAFGIPCIYPQIPDILPYHNNAVWPFVETFWGLAAAKTGNDGAALQAIASVYRSAALFLTNKENIVADNGDFAGTQINSSNMLWSLSGNIAIVYKLLFGMEYQQQQLVFHPFVPAQLSGSRKLSNFKYRGAILDVELTGYGHKLKQVLLDGKPVNEAAIPASLTGKHRLKLELDNALIPQAKTIAANYTAPETPVVTLATGKLKWVPVKGAIKYNIYTNGKLAGSTAVAQFPVITDVYREYQVTAVDRNKVASFASESVTVSPKTLQQIVEAEDVAGRSEENYHGFSGNGFVEISTEKNKTLSFKVNVEKEGWYAVDFKYANGNGPINTENKCAIRSLAVNGKFSGTIVFPQRGKGEWSNWGWSNAQRTYLTKGNNEIALQFRESNQNMNGVTNQAMVDYLHLQLL